MRTGICPKCGSDEVYLKARNGGTQGVNVLRASRWKYVRMDNYVCGACGYIEFYLSDPSGLQRIKETWETA